MRLLPVLCAALVWGVVPVAADDQVDGPTAADLELIAGEIDALRTRNEQLGQRLDESQGDAWLDSQRAREIRDIVQDVLADSSTRSSLQSSNVQAGYESGSGFFLKSADDSFSLHINGQIQFRWVLNHNGSGQDYDYAEYVSDVFNGTSTRVGPKTAWGGSVRRAKVRFQGNVFDPTWTYRINGSFSSSSGEFNFEEVDITKDLGNGMHLTLGQMKTPFLREELVGSAHQLAVDRSLVNEFFNQNRGVGIEFGYKTDDLRAHAYYGNGSRTAIDQTARGSNWADNPTRWAFAGRLEYKIAGEWDDFNSFTSEPGHETAVMVGVAAMGQAYNGAAGFGTVFGIPGLGSLLSLEANLDGSTVYGVTADVSAKFGSVSLYAAFVWQHYEIKGTGELFGTPIGSYSVPGTNPWGFVLQGGYSLNEKIELFGRYSFINADLGNFELSANGLPPPLPPAIGPIPIPLGESSTSVITIGANYFISENVKATVDWGINLESTLIGLGESSLGGLGWGVTNSGHEWVLRAQLQLLF